MITRRDVVEKAIMDCLKELYSKVQPAVDWDDFMQQNKDYSVKYQQWDQTPNHQSMQEFCGPRPFEFYYLPQKVMKEIADSYVTAYRIDTQQELLNTIEILKSYCEDTIIDKYIDEHTDENGNWHPGYRGYERPDNLEGELRKIIKPAENIPLDKKESYEKSYNKLIEDVRNKFFEFLDMAGKFYSWNSDLNDFNTSVYLGPSPNSNKQAVIDNWKKYRNKDITIDDSIYENEDD